MPTKTQGKYFLRYTLCSELIHRETVAKKVAMSTKAKTEEKTGGTEQNTIVLWKCRNDGTNKNLSGKRGKVAGKVVLLITSSVISGVKGYHLMLADQLIDV